MTTTKSMGYSERLKRESAALDKMWATWKSGVPVRRWGYARVLVRLLCRAGHT